MKKPFLVLLGLTLGAGMLALAQGVSFKLESFTLPNGLQVVLHKDSSLPTAAVNLYFKVGSKDEPAKRSGFAHLFEHLMFMGTVAAPNFDKIMEAEGGTNNAQTWTDWTRYFSSGPASSLPTLLWLEADRLANLGRNIDQKKLDLQRNVVLNEMRQNVLDTPYGQAEDQLVKWLYPQNHPYHNPVIGSEEDLKAATVDDVKRFFAQYYVPNNATMTVVGDFDPKATKASIEKLFKAVPRGNEIPRNPVPTVQISRPKRVVYTDDVPTPRVIMAWHSDKFGTTADADLDLTARLLTNGLSSYLYEALVNQGLADEVSAFQNSQVLGSYFQLEATAAEEVSSSKLEAAMDAALKAFLKKPVAAAELGSQVVKLETERLNALQGVDAKAMALNDNLFYFGNANAFETNLNRYRQATPTRVFKTAQSTLDFNKRVILTVLPSPKRGDAETVIERPVSSSASAITLPSAVQFTLAGGAKLVYFQRDLPLTAVTALVNGGSSRDTIANSGQASLMAEMLTRGAGQRKAQNFEDALTALGASLGASAGWENTTVNLSVLTKNLEPALGLFADALKSARLEPSEFKTAQAGQLAGLKGRNNDLTDVARQVALREFWGASHPLGHPIDGLSSSAKNLTLLSLKSLYAQQFNASNTTIYAASSQSPVLFKTKLEAALKGWVIGTPLPAVNYPTPANNSKQRVVIVDRPGSSQTAVRFLFAAPSSQDTNTNRLESILQVLGGSFTSRLNQNLREDKGYTYGAGAGLVSSQNFAYVRASAAVEQSVTGVALKEFLLEFKRLQTADFTPEEAKRAAATRQNDTLSALGTIDGLLATAIDRASRGSSLAGLGSDLTALAGFDAKALNDLAPSALKLENSVLVLVGDKAKIMPQLEGLGLPAPETVIFE